MADAQRSKGLEGVVIGSTSISLVEGTEGRLSYRGYKIQDLAANSTFEEVFYLLINGELPTKAQLTDFANAMRERRDLPAEAMKVLRAVSSLRVCERCEQKMRIQPARPTCAPSRL